MSGAVPPAYRHQPKSVDPREHLVAPSAYLKWYDVAQADTPVPATVGAQARTFVETQLADTSLGLNDDHGFVILHRCGDDFYFLLLQVWRGANELWEAVYAKVGDDPFSAFAPAYPDKGLLRPTFCVWELGIVAHEAQAWTRFLESPRDAAAQMAWTDDCYQGPV